MEEGAGDNQPSDWDDSLVPWRPPWILFGPGYGDRLH